MKNLGVLSTNAVEAYTCLPIFGLGAVIFGIICFQFLCVYVVEMYDPNYPRPVNTNPKDCLFLALVFGVGCILCIFICFSLRFFLKNL